MAGWVTNGYRDAGREEAAWKSSEEGREKELDG
jgi:hypothetical protein